MNKKIIIRLTFFLILVWSITACDDMNATYKEFLEGGEMVYPGKADSLKAYPGNYRIKLSWLILTDPSITHSKVFWNNRQDSIDVILERTQGIDTITVLLTEMDERQYTFEIYNYDNKGNMSVGSELLGIVYGDKHRKSLINRLIKKISFIDDHLLIEWEKAEEHTIGQEITYLNKNGNIQTDFVPAEKDSTLMENYDINVFDIGYRTIFQPDSLAIDTFRTDIQDIHYEMAFEINRNGFTLKDLPGDENEANSANNSIDRLWTNDYSITATPFISKAWQINDCDNLVPFPYWFTIDLGQAYYLTSFTIFQRGGGHEYRNNNLRKFEIWGALEVDETYNPKDHGNIFDDNWILLEDCEIIRPADQSIWLSEAAKGNQFNLRVNGNPLSVRYLRIKAIDNWLYDTGSCEIVKKRTYINFASIRLEAILQPLD